MCIYLRACFERPNTTSSVRPRSGGGEVGKPRKTVNTMLSNVYNIKESVCVGTDKSVIPDSEI